MKALIGLITILIAAGCSPTGAGPQRTCGGRTTARRSRYCCGGGGDGDCCNDYYCYCCRCSDGVRRRRRCCCLCRTTPPDRHWTPLRWPKLPQPKKNNEDDDDQTGHNCRGEHLNCILYVSLDSLTHHHWTGILLIVLKYVLSPFVNIVYHLDSSRFASC